MTDKVKCESCGGTGYCECAELNQECIPTPSSYECPTCQGSGLRSDEAPYYYAWKNNPKRKTLYGRKCRIVARGKMNSILIEFEDGQRECVSRNAVRKIKATP
jgi:hypothetical protein